MRNAFDGWMYRETAARLAAFLVLLGITLAATGGELVLKTAQQSPPAEIAEPIRKLLQPVAIQLLDGQTAAYQFWLTKELAVKSKPSTPTNALPLLKPTAILGAVAITGTQRDYRNDEIAPGIYTMRLGLQPEDGDHLGTSEYSFFAVLVPAKFDTSPEGIATYDALVKASSKERPTGHPIVFSLRPATSVEGALPQIAEPVPEHKSIRLRFPIKPSDSGGASNAIFELVYKGKAKK